MSPERRFLAVSIALGLAAGCGGSKSAAPQPPPGPAARSIRTITSDGGRLDWSADGQLIAFDRVGADGYYDVYTMRPDGTGATCLTCDNRPGFPTRNMGNPAWHPSGSFIVFQAQKDAVTGPLLDQAATPGIGVNNDLWVMDSAGAHAWRLTDVPVGPGGVLHAHFSHRGDQLLWAERVSGQGGPPGTWVLRIASFHTDGSPRIDNVRTYQPGAQKLFYESHGFTPDDSAILFSGTLQPGQTESQLDVYRMTLSTQEVVDLTTEPDTWDEHAQISPSGRTIVWMSSRDQNVASGLRTDFWTMNADGSNKQRLTYFNDASHAEFIPGGAVAADSSWSPDGTRLAGYVIANGATQFPIVIIDMSGSQTAQPPASSGEAARPHGPGAGAGGAPAGARLQALRISAIGGSDDALSWGDRVAEASARGELVLTQATVDPLAPWLRVERYAQTREGVPIFGGDVVRETDGRRTLAVFGTWYAGGSMAGVPQLSPDDAAAAIERAAQVADVARRPRLVIVPAGGVPAMAYAATVASGQGVRSWFVDATTGAPLMSIPAPAGQAGTGQGGAPPRLDFFAPLAGTWVAEDTTRSPGILTYEMRGDLGRTLAALNGVSGLRYGDLASAADVESGNAAVAWVHRAAAGAYDYLRSRFGRAGLAEQTPMINLVHAAPPASGFARETFYAGGGVMVFGDAVVAGGDPAATLRVVTHEIGHGVVEYGSQLITRGESGAIGEALADLLADGAVRVAVQDDAAEGTRALEPIDHASAWRLDADAAAMAANGGVVREAFRLALYGGVNRTSGVEVAGIGGARRALLEQVFYRGLGQLLPSDATLAMARAATLQAAADLSPDPALRKAVAAAWQAVGVE